jgi:hypothetical protein
VCRKSYIDPRVVDRYNDGLTIRDDLHRLGADAVFGELATQGPIEESVLRLLEDPGADRRRTARGTRRRTRTAPAGPPAVDAA